MVLQKDFFIFRKFIINLFYHHNCAENCDAKSLKR